MGYRSKKKGILIAFVCVLMAAIALGVIARRSVQEPVTEKTFDSTHQTMDAEVAEDGTDVLNAAFAGSWYDADPDKLRRDIADYLAKAPVEPKQDIIALVLPHAGYAYSGPTAACGVKSLGRSYKRVVVIGPSHRLPMEEMFSVPRATHFQTPLGQVSLDVDFIRELLAYPVFQSVPAAHQQEHSVEAEIPLLQHKLGDFRLVPIVAGQCSHETVAQAGKILAGLIDADTLVVASSDFTHHGPQYRYEPFKEDVPENIKKLDMGAFEYIRKLDAQGLLTYRDEMHATICGCVPMAVVLEMLSKDSTVELLQYTTSGEVTGDYTNSVSYLAAAFRGAWGASSPVPKAHPLALTPEDRKQLLALARRTLRYALDHQMAPQPSDLEFTASEPMKRPRAAFVTLKKNGQLRGCVGDIFPQRPLHKSVISNAIYAAFRDNRFQPLRSDELAQIQIEISALTTPTPVSSWQEIRIGLDGVVLNKAGHSAVFLPQVAPEQGWDLETTLRQLSLKARLPADAWRKGASFLVFQADVFGEEP